MRERESEVGVSEREREGVCERVPLLTPRGIPFSGLCAGRSGRSAPEGAKVAGREARGGCLHSTGRGPGAGAIEGRPTGTRSFRSESIDLFASWCVYYNI